jgi:hypothetical protein
LIGIAGGLVLGEALRHLTVLYNVYVKDTFCASVEGEITIYTGDSDPTIRDILLTLADQKQFDALDVEIADADTKQKIRFEITMNVNEIE